MLQNVFVYVETTEGKPVNVGLEMLTAAKKISDKTTAVLIGAKVAEAAQEAIHYGADCAVIVEDPSLEKFTSDAYTKIIEELMKKYNPDAVVIGATQNGKDFAPRVAARFSTGCVADALNVALGEDSIITWTCPVYGGTVLTDVIMNTKPQIGTIRSGAFKKADIDSSKSGEVITETVSISDSDIKTKIVESVKEIAESINLEEAEVIVAGGRGMGSAENFALVQQFADLLGGVVGATRAAIESGWISRAHQVGQSGKIVAPKLYIACGISGATQHVSGMIGSDFIVAINKDEDAPIFDVANVGIVGNAMDIIPLMMEEIKKLKD